jgi:hypothetical protein
MSRDAHVRIGDFFYPLAEGPEFYERTGVPPMDLDWRSIFAGRQNVQGAPGVQNVRDEDLRWVSTSFAGGQGRTVIDPSVAEDFRRFDRSVGIDLGSTGEMRLTREMFQYGRDQNNPQSPTLHEGSTFSDEIGASTVGGTDRRLNSNGDTVKKDVALSAGTHQITVYGYVDGPTETVLTLGSVLEEVQGSTAISGTAIGLKTERAKVRSAALNFTSGVSVQVTAALRLVAGAVDVRAQAQLLIRDMTTDTPAASMLEFLASPDAEGAVTQSTSPTLTFIAKAGHSYRVEVELRMLDGQGAAFFVDQVETLELGAQTAEWRISEGATVRASRVSNVRGVTTSRQIGASTVRLGSATTLSLRLVRSSGAAKVWLDRFEIVTFGPFTPRAIGLGIEDKIWLVDDAPVPHIVWWWDASSNRWLQHTGIPDVGLVNTMCSSEAHQYVLLQTGKVFRWSKTPGIELFAEISPAPSPAAIAYAEARLYVLTENPDGGTLWSRTSLETPDDPWQFKYGCGPIGLGPTDELDLGLPQRMATVGAGVIFFQNQGGICIIHHYDGAAGSPLTSLPMGFRGRALVHGGGTTYVGGGFPAKDATGQTTMRPSVFTATGLRGEQVEVGELDVKLWHEDDPPAKIAAMQQYGSDLWLQVEVATDATHPRRHMQLWRISLRGDPAAFLEHEVEIQPEQVSGRARGLAVTWRDRFAIWTSGGPYQVAERFATAGDAFVRTSRYAFGLLEQKLLLHLDLDATIPAGTWVELYYSADGGAFQGARRFLEPGRTIVSVPGRSRFFQNLRLEAHLRSTNPAITPIVYAFGAGATIQEYDRAWNLLLLCADETAVWRKDGSQVPGYVGVDYLLDLAESEGVVEFENFYRSKRPEDGLIHMVTVESPRPLYMQRGEALVRVRLSERGLIPR